MYSTKGKMVMRQMEGETAKPRQAWSVTRSSSVMKGNRLTKSKASTPLKPLRGSQVTKKQVLHTSDTILLYLPKVQFKLPYTQL